MTAVGSLLMSSILPERAITVQCETSRRGTPLPLRDRRSSVRYGHHPQTGSGALCNNNNNRLRRSSRSPPSSLARGQRPRLGVPIRGPAARRPAARHRRRGRAPCRSSRSCCRRSSTATPVVEPDLLVRLRSRFALEIARRPRRAARTRLVCAQPGVSRPRLQARPSSICSTSPSELEARGMPAELALLPIVESAFDPFAYSHGRAAGLWQIIPGTGKRLGPRAELVVRRPPRRARVDARGARLPASSCTSSSTAIGCSPSPATTPAKATSRAR